jgi:cytochrome P450
MLRPVDNSDIPELTQLVARNAATVYIPFGGGPRNCIGATFAQIESKVVLA